MLYIAINWKSSRHIRSATQPNWLTIASWLFVLKVVVQQAAQYTATSNGT
jgi:hypothetical protein